MSSNFKTLRLHVSFLKINATCSCHKTNCAFLFCLPVVGAFPVCTFSTKCVLTSGWSPIRSAPYAEWTLRPSCQVKVDTMFQNSRPPSFPSSRYCSQPKTAWLTCADSEALNLECWLCYMVQLMLDLQFMYTVDFDVFIKAFFF